MPYKDINKQREYQRIRQQQNKAKYRAIVVEMFGGKCQKCNYSENIYAFQIDHIVPILRNKNRTDNSKQIWRKLALGKISKDGLQLLCANCHSIKTLEVDIKTFKFTGRPKNTMLR
jgi:5-methylcytosine-specific restriction endonuclease McrA